ncbi:MAG: hypothetical protein HLUCCO02_12325 [Idiomarinaceae bacterium HL-53]|nr:MAG: hypothetical protein HLUCCO02_12325 [Idiomarinaceae bacterium HL-53]CUS49589.1 hypothetical protein Ga0003345_2589 [Idiomarinaceae bacterium HL-53]
MSTMNFGHGLTREHVKLVANWLKVELFGASNPLFASASVANEFPHGLRADGEVRVVFITLSDLEGQHVVAHSMGLGVEQTARSALIKARALAKFKIKAAKLDLVSEAWSVDMKSLKRNRGFVGEPSFQGIALDTFENAWLPEENLRYRLVKSGGGIDYEQLISCLSYRLPQIADYEERAPREAWSFVSASFYLSWSGVLALVRGHRESYTLTPQIAKDRALAGARYLAKAVQGDGRYAYMYRSGPNVDVDDYNMVRHAGTTWALLDLLPDFPDRERAFVESAIDRAVDYLLAQIQPDPLRRDNSQATVVVEDDVAKLGGNGLAVVALVEYYKLRPNDDLLNKIRELAYWIVENQSEEGQLTRHKMNLATGELSEFISDYYPGEAILGLMKLFSVDPDPRWKDAAAQCTRWLINVRDLGKTLDELEHDHWLLYGINEVYHEVPEEQFIEHSRKLVEAMLRTQYDNPRCIFEPEKKKISDWSGGWYSPPRTTPAACRVEGMMAAANLLRKVGAEDEVAEILSACEAGIKFQLQNQLWDEKLMYLADPERARGGFHSSFSNWHIRIDYVQHSISAFIAWSRF